MSPIDDHHTIVINRPDGTQIRWADDEPNVENVPADLTYSDSVPGGFKSASCSLARSLRNVGREGLYDDARILGPGGAIRFEGRLQQMPASTDNGGRTTPQIVGWQAHLDDDGTAKEIYRDASQERWGAVSVARRLEILNAQYKPFDGAVSSWQGDNVSYGPALHLGIEGYAWSSNQGRPDCELVYDSGGIPLGALEGGFYSNLGGDPNWRTTIFGFDSVAAPNYVALATPSASTGPGSPVPIAVSAAGRKRLLFALSYVAAPAGTTDATWYSGIRSPIVRGNHGLPANSSGLLASDVIANAVARWAPKLRATTGPNGSIRTTDYLIPHLVFAEHTTATDIVQRTNAFHQWDWAVWENKTFYYRPRDTGRTWKIATADGLDLSLEGDTTDRIATGVVVTYTDYAGVQRSVGPTGSGAEITDPALISTDPANPAVAHGLRVWKILALSAPSDPASATAIGRSWLTVQALASRRGQATITGWISDDTGAMRPVSEVRSGDTLIVTDRPDDPPRRIIEKTYSYGPRTTQLTLDSTAATLDAILERLGAALVGTV